MVGKNNHGARYIINTLIYILEVQGQTETTWLYT